jgi:hypothetical protein
MNLKPPVMRPTAKIPGYILLTCLFSLMIGSCHKESEVLSDLNHPPIARAGADQVISFSICSQDHAVLDASQSNDPDEPNDKIISYLWTKISGPSVFTLKSFPGSINKSIVENMLPGNYLFELKVTDTKGTSSKDTVRLTVTGLLKEYDFETSFTCDYIFMNNYQDCWDYFLGSTNFGSCDYYDHILIQGSGNFPELGQFNLTLEENSDSSDISTIHTTSIDIRKENKAFIFGSCTVNFKRLIQTGGGSFTGTLLASLGSVRPCDSTILSTLIPLNVTGNLDTLTKRATVNIRGRVYF